MSQSALGPRNVVAAVVLIGGVLMVAFPRHALTIVQLMVLSAAVAVGVQVLARHVPATGWISPFRWLSPFGGRPASEGPRHRSREFELIRARFSGRRQRLEGAPPMPPSLLRQLRPLLARALDIDPEDPEELLSARDRVSPVSWAVLLSEPMERVTWLGTVRPDPDQVTATVHRVLDDFDRLTGGSRPRPSVDPSRQGDP